MMKMVTIEQMHTLCDFNNKETPRCSRGVVINEKDVDAADVDDGHDLITIHSSTQADLFLAQALDHEVAAEHQVRLWLFIIMIMRRDKELLLMGIIKMRHFDQLYDSPGSTHTDRWPLGQGQLHQPIGDCLDQRNSQHPLSGLVPGVDPGRGHERQQPDLHVAALGGDLGAGEPGGRQGRLLQSFRQGQRRFWTGQSRQVCH